MIPHHLASVLRFSAVAVALAVPATAAADTTATSSRTCNISGKERRLGATYVTALSAVGTSCANAERVVKAFHACRHRRGKAGYCRTTVRGYRCRESRFNRISTQYDSRVRCTYGSRRVNHTYTQFT